MLVTAQALLLDGEFDFVFIDNRDCAVVVIAEIPSTSISAPRGHRPNPFGGGETGAASATARAANRSKTTAAAQATSQAKG